MAECGYHYQELYDIYIKEIRNILLGLRPEYLDGRPYSIYETIDEYIKNKDNLYKGLLVWEVNKYYKGTFLIDYYKNNQPLNPYETSIAFFVVPEFGQVVIDNIQYKQNIVISFDTNVTAKFDPFGTKIIEVVNWFLEKHRRYIEKDQLMFPSNQQNIFIKTSGISAPIYSFDRDGVISYSRRSVQITLRFCDCY